MSITAYDTVRMGSVTTVTVTSTLSGSVLYHWFVDGAYVGFTSSPSKSFALDEGEQARVECIDTNYPGFDPLRNPPAGYPARRTIFFLRSLDTDVDHYRIEQREDPGSAPPWDPIAIVRHDEARWSYIVLTGRLNDLTQYDWRVVPVDAAGNDGTEIQLEVQRVVRTPDSPTFTATFAPATTKVAFA